MNCTTARSQKENKEHMAATRKKKTSKKKATRKKATRKKKPVRRKKAKKKATARKKAPRKKAAKKKRKKSKRKAGGAFMAPLTLSPELAAVVGTKKAPRTQVTKKLWGYIKKNKLQDKVNRRMIIADAKLKLIFNKPKLDMFQMTKYVSRHMS